MQPSADEDNDDVIESFWLYIFSVFPSFVYYYLKFLYLRIYNTSDFIFKFLYLRIYNTSDFIFKFLYLRIYNTSDFIFKFLYLRISFLRPHDNIMLQPANIPVNFSLNIFLVFAPSDRIEMDSYQCPVKGTLLPYHLYTL